MRDLNSELVTTHVLLTPSAGPIEEFPVCNYFDSRSTITVEDDDMGSESTIKDYVIECDSQLIEIPATNGIISSQATVEHSIDEENKQNEESDCVVLGKMDDQNNAYKVLAEMPEPFLEKYLLGIDVEKVAHNLLDEKPVLSPVDLDEDLYVSAPLLSFSKVSIQDVSYEDDVLGVSETNSPSFPKLGFNPQVFDPGTLYLLIVDAQRMSSYVNTTTVFHKALVKGATTMMDVTLGPIDLVDEAQHMFHEISPAFRTEEDYESQLNENEGRLHWVCLVHFQVVSSHNDEYFDTVAHSLFANMSKQYSSKQKVGVEGLRQPTSRNWKPFVVKFTGNLCSKDADTSFVSAISSPKVTLGELVVFMFDQCLSSWHLMGCVPINYSEMPNMSTVVLWISKVMFCFDTGGSHWLQMGCDLFEFNGELRDCCGTTNVDDAPLKFNESYNDAGESISPFSMVVSPNQMKILTHLQYIQVKSGEGSSCSAFTLNTVSYSPVAVAEGVDATMIGAYLEEFIWDPGICTIFVYILEDKDVFKGVGNRILVMVMIISIRDGQIKLRMIRIEEVFGSMTTCRNETTYAPTIFIVHYAAPKADKMLINEVGESYSSENRGSGIADQLFDEMAGLFPIKLEFRVGPHKDLRLPIAAVLKYMESEGLASEVWLTKFLSKLKFELNIKFWLGVISMFGFYPGTDANEGQWNAYKGHVNVQCIIAVLFGIIDHLVRCRPFDPGGCLFPQFDCDHFESIVPTRVHVSTLAVSKVMVLYMFYLEVILQLGYIHGIVFSTFCIVIKRSQGMKFFQIRVISSHNFEPVQILNVFFLCQNICKVMDVIGHLRLSYEDAKDGYLQLMEHYGEGLAKSYMRDMDDIGLTPNARTFFTTELEHYIWDPGLWSVKPSNFAPIFLARRTSRRIFVWHPGVHFTTLRTRCLLGEGDVTNAYVFLFMFILLLVL